MTKQKSKPIYADGPQTPNTPAAAEVAHVEIVPKPTARILQLVTDTGLTEDQARLALELSRKRPNVVKAYADVRKSENSLKGKWFNLCESLRETGSDGQILNGSEMKLLLRALGENRQRISEIIRVVTVAPDVWEAYKSRLVGFRAVLKLARGPAEINGTGANSDTHEQPETTAKKEADAPDHRAFPSDIAGEIMDFLALHGETLLDTEGRKFHLIYEIPSPSLNKPAIKFDLTLTVHPVT